ncbi:hypothetical protein KIL84_008606 [Mauremys mutica]|uniref:Uncharacterized protein n=1 Tax=Mauremys mutica TaxID=74926 RepID=A0A9D4AZK7_9SAUR|nr:hypothetical protein KIL84_008606 [Mauremys mutica]
MSKAQTLLPPSLTTSCRNGHVPHYEQLTPIIGHPTQVLVCSTYTEGTVVPVPLSHSMSAALDLLREMQLSGHSEHEPSLPTPVSAALQGKPEQVSFCLGSSLNSAEASRSAAQSQQWEDGSQEEMKHS